MITLRNPKNDRRKSTFGSSSLVAIGTLVIAVIGPILSAVYIGATTMTKVEGMSSWMVNHVQQDREVEARLRAVEEKAAGWDDRKHQ